MAEEARRPGAGECWAVFLVALTCYLFIACYLVLNVGRVDWDALAGTAHAYEAVIAARPPNLALVGFADPPLPVIVQLPLVAAAPRLATEGLAPNVVSGVFGALTCVLLCRLLAELGAATSLRWALVAAFGLSPAWLRAVAQGASLALFALFFVASVLCFVRWARGGALRDLVLAGLAGAGAILTHFESAGVILALCIAFVAVVRRDRRGSWSEAEGTLITFLLPVVYVALLWLATSWAIMHDPLFPIRAMRRTPEVALLAVSEFLLTTALVTWFRAATRPWHARCRWAPATVAALLLGAGLCVVAGWRTHSLPVAQPYSFLDPASPDERTLADLREVARHVHLRCGDERVLVDSQLDFAMALLSGAPYQFIRPVDLERGGRRPGASRTDVSFVLADARAPNVGIVRAQSLAGIPRLKPVWSRGPWTLYARRAALR